MSHATEAAWQTRWGATAAECHQHLPGDDLIPAPGWIYNHAVTINAPSDVIWPLLLRFCEGRRFGAVSIVKPGRAIVLSALPDDHQASQTWAFYLVPMAAEIYVGIPVTAHNNATLATGVFRNFSVGLF